MKVPLSWLKQYVEIPDDLPVEEFAQKMIMSGSEVEGWETSSGEISGVVVGRIDSIAKHEDSDHLLICRVDVGQQEAVQIVTGATNVFEGAVVPVALVGARLAGGYEIKKSRLRGVDSFGMLCSGQELGADAEKFPESAVDGIWILNEKTLVGADIHQIIGRGDVVIDFKTLANRPDCMSLIGIAREVAATLGTKLTLPDVLVKETPEDSIHGHLGICIENEDLCPRYLARMVGNIRIKPSPDWMQQALLGAGVRPINNVVDITNYVMLETGQPMHAFDFSCVRGGRIIVRTPRDGERETTTLDGQRRKLDEDVLCICDAEGIIGLAGIMGGENSEITGDTKAVVLESAKFDRTSLRLSSRRIGLRTEASARFEKGISAQLPKEALERAAQLFAELDAGDVLFGVIDVYPGKEEIQSFDVSVAGINALLGMEIPAGDMVRILESLFFSPRFDGGDTISVTVPHWRGDVDGQADIAEEVLRIYGYDRIPSTLMRGDLMQGMRTRQQQLSHDIKRYLSDIGVSEVITFSFESPRVNDIMLFDKEHPAWERVRLLNPLGEDMSVMRTNLLPGMLQTAGRNVRYGNDEVALFEMGNVFIPVEGGLLPNEPKRLCILRNTSDFFDLKGVIEGLFAHLGIKGVAFVPGGDNFFHPGRKAGLMLGEVCLGQMGEIHPDVAAAFDMAGRRVYAAEFDLEALLSSAAQERSYRPIPNVPAVVRDLAVVVSEDVPAGDLAAALRRSGGDTLRDVQVFDIYRGEHVSEGEKSIAFTLTYQLQDRTLTDDEVSRLFDKAVRSLSAQFGAKLRG
ncbi:MAG: phenylalanine--tRNA ligase subunit beta [Christensenellales bacterium]|jgi:phenylalanyl-tRNA synthetase beta chain